jgi:hypothetical protein
MSPLKSTILAVVFSLLAAFCIMCTVFYLNDKISGPAIKYYVDANTYVCFAEFQGTAHLVKCDEYIWTHGKDVTER